MSGDTGRIQRLAFEAILSTAGWINPNDRKSQKKAEQIARDLLRKGWCVSLSCSDEDIIREIAKRLLPPIKAFSSLKFYKLPPTTLGTAKEMLKKITEGGEIDTLVRELPNMSVADRDRLYDLAEKALGKIKADTGIDLKIRNMIIDNISGLMSKIAKTLKPITLVVAIGMLKKLTQDNRKAHELLNKKPSPSDADWKFISKLTKEGDKIREAFEKAIPTMSAADKKILFVAAKEALKTANSAFKQKSFMLCFYETIERIITAIKRDLPEIKLD